MQHFQNIENTLKSCILVGEKTLTTLENNKNNIFFVVARIRNIAELSRTGDLTRHSNGTKV